MLVMIGVDPGGRDVGMVVRTGDEVIDFVVRQSLAPPNEPPPKEFGWAVCDWVAEARDHALEAGHRVLIAVEGLVVPTGYRKGAASGERSRVRPGAMMGVSMVFGAVTATFRDALVVQPGDHGQHNLRTYPKELVGPRVTTGTGDILRHARSAWDVAWEGRRLARFPQLQ